MAQDLPIPQKTDNTGKNYAIDLFYDSFKLTNYVRRVRIINDINSYWPRILIDLNISAEDIISNDIYGGKDFRMEITTIGPGKQQLATDTYYLLYMESNVSLIPENEKAGLMAMRQTVTFMFVPTYAFNVFGSFVNIILDKNSPEDKNMTVSPGWAIDIFQNIFLNKCKFEQLKLDKSNANTKLVEEMIIPPMSIRQCLDYMDSKFSFFKSGVSFYYCDKDGQLNLWELNSRSDGNPVFTVYQISAGDVDDKTIAKVIDSEVRDDQFYTSAPIQTNYSANAIMMRQGHTNCVITSPNDRLFRFYSGNASSGGEENVKYHESLKARKRYFTYLSSFSEYLVKNMLGKTFINFSKLKLSLTGTLLTKNLMRIGEPVEIKPANTKFLSYQGKYILETSDLVFDRSGGNNWIATCAITLIRMNQSQTQPDVSVRKNM